MKENFEFPSLGGTNFKFPSEGGKFVKWKPSGKPAVWCCSFTPAHGRFRDIPLVFPAEELIPKMQKDVPIHCL
jgi:hypothetical protein